VSRNTASIRELRTMPIANWSAALNRFAIEFAERMPQLN